MESLLKIKKEDIFFLGVIFLILSVSILSHDDILSILSASLGIVYTVLIGKGKAAAYFFGALGVLFGAILTYKIGLFGNSFLHFFYYFPMMIIGYLNWRKHLDSKNEVIKEKLDKKTFLLYILFSFILSFILYLTFIKIGDKSPLLDSVITVFSLFGMFLTVKRYVEQWIIWIFVDFLLILMWFLVIKNGEHTIAVLISRVVYLILGIYFYKKWKNETCFKH